MNNFLIYTKRTWWFIADLFRASEKIVATCLFYFDKDATGKHLRKWNIASVGDNTWIAPSVRFDLFKSPAAKHLQRPLISIGNNCIITEYTQFITHDTSKLFFQKLFKKTGQKKWGEIIIKDNVFIGAGCIVLPGVTIGPNSLVGAGSLVSKDVLPNSVYAGNPAKKIMSINEYIKQ